MTPAYCKSTRRRIGTQAQVAALLGVHRVTVAKWETGALPVPRMASIALASLAKKRAKQIDASNTTCSQKPVL
jgi:DNA-binding XRE family transcriptional regulator